MKPGTGQAQVHLYCGDGKGKTTAAFGLCLRMAGAGGRVLVAQFFKDGSSCEIGILQGMGVEVQVETQHFGRCSQMSEDARARAREAYSALFERVTRRAADGFRLLVLDEIVSACNTGMVSETRLIRFLKTRPAALEVVLTGRDPSAALIEQADYVTEMRKLAHPYDEGLYGRRGIEF